MSWQTGLNPSLTPWFEWILSYMTYFDPTIRVSSAYRSPTEQARLYRRFLAGLMPGPVAPPGRSLHEQGRAIDVWSNAWERAFDPRNPPAALVRAGAAWEAVGGTWGGHFRSVASDPIHFEA